MSDEIIKKFKKYSSNPCVHAFEGDLMKGHNFHFYSNGWNDGYRKSIQDNSELKQKLEKAIKALEFYANGCNGEDDCTYGNIMKGGKLARQTLKELKEGE